MGGSIPTTLIIKKLNPKFETHMQLHQTLHYDFKFGNDTCKSFQNIALDKFTSI